MAGRVATRFPCRSAALAVLTAGIAIAGAPHPAAAQAMRVREHVEVPRVVVDVRVVDRRGDPVMGLAPADFRALVDGAPAAVESAEWVAGTAPYAEGLTPEQAVAAGAQAAPPGRLVVLFFQSDFAQVRLAGLMQMKFRAIELLAKLQPADRVAVVSFDSHLRLRLDFTSDRASITAAIHRAILFGGEPGIAPGPFPSLAASFDAAAAARAASPEAGLLVTARALEALPGAKSLVFFGWGLGTKMGPWIWMGHSYGLAREALLRARVSVFAIDVTDADYHDLEVGLQQVAADTGGFYAKTNLFPGQAITRLEGALAGHYVLVLVRPEGPRGWHALTIALPGRTATVLAKPTFRD
ncbi:MAG: VWA domain-containing protein [Acidobacteria bacterium]|nr:MAG: VWA domain-containing protein [Acidobacteriota bacterium]